MVTTNSGKGQQAPAEIRLCSAVWASYSTAPHPVEVLNPPLKQPPADAVSQNLPVDKLWLQLTMFFHIITKMKREFQPRTLTAFKLHGILLLSSVWLDSIQCMRPDGAFTGIKPEQPEQYQELAVSSVCIWLVQNTPTHASQLKIVLRTWKVRMQSFKGDHHASPRDFDELDLTKVWFH